MELLPVILRHAWVLAELTRTDCIGRALAHVLPPRSTLGRKAHNDSEPYEASDGARATVAPPLLASPVDAGHSTEGDGASMSVRGRTGLSGANTRRSNWR